MNKFEKIFNDLLNSTTTIENFGDKYLKAEYVFGTCAVLTAVMIIVGK